MSARRRSNYYKYLDSSISSRKKKSSVPGKILKLILFLSILGFTWYYISPSKLVSFDALLQYLPVPKTLLSIQVLHNDEKISLEPNAQLVVNPRDSLQVLGVKTDGWVQWGVKLAVGDLPPEALTASPVVFAKLWPNDNFETPRKVELQASWMDRPLGQATILIQLDARDWLQKALAESNEEQKIAYLKKVLEENPNNTLVKTQLAGLYYDNKQYSQAAQLYEEIAEKGKSKEILEKMYLTYQHQGKVDQALKMGLEILNISHNPEDFKKLLQYLQKQKSREDTVAFLNKNQQSIPREFQANVVLLLADLYGQMKDWGKAAAKYEEAMRRGVRDPNISYNLAVAYQQTKDWNRSSKALENYLEKNPKDLKSRIELGQLQERQGDLNKARATYEAILKDDPKQEGILVQLIALLEKANDKSALQTYYQKLAALQPKNKVTQHNLGVLYYQSKNWPDATKQFETVASLDSKDLESRKYLLDLYRKQGKEKEELGMLLDLVQLRPDQTDYYDDLFNIYNKKKDYGAIVELFQKATLAHPNSVQFHQYLLLGLLKTGNKKEAVKELEDLIRLEPKEKKYLRQAANLYEDLGNHGEALKKLEQYLKVDPKNKEAQDDYMRLRMRSLTPKKAG